MHLGHLAQKWYVYIQIPHNHFSFSYLVVFISKSMQLGSSICGQISCHIQALIRAAVTDIATCTTVIPIPTAVALKHNQNYYYILKIIITYWIQDNNHVDSINWTNEIRQNTSYFHSHVNTCSRSRYQQGLNSMFDHNGRNNPHHISPHEQLMVSSEWCGCPTQEGRAWWEGYQSPWLKQQVCWNTSYLKGTQNFSKHPEP